METKEKKVVALDIPVPGTFDTLEYMYSDLDEKIKNLTKQKNDLKKEILNKFETEFGHQGQSIISKLTGNTLQRVISVLQDIDDSKLKKCLPKEIWDEVTIQKPSLELVLSAIKMKRIDPAKIADAIETKEVDKLIVRKGK
jgi:hypothetical protein